jgi:hypothetical protein
LWRREAALHYDAEILGEFRESRWSKKWVGETKKKGAKPLDAILKDLGL